MMNYEALKEELAATFRAMAQDDGVELRFPLALSADRARAEITASDQISVTLSPALTAATLTRLRGELDRMALHHRWRNLPPVTARERTERATLTLLEQTRREILGAQRMRGTAQNLLQHWGEELRLRGYHRAEAVGEMPAQEVLRLLVIKHMLGIAPEEAAMALDTVGRVMEAQLKKELVALSGLLDDPVAYQAAITRMLRKLAGAEQSENAGDESMMDATPQAAEDSPQEITEDVEQSDQSSIDASGEEQADRSQEDAAPLPGAEMGEALPDEAESPAAPDDHAEEGAHTTLIYRAYTTKFDQILHATELADAEELRQLRTQLDGRLNQLRDITGRLASKLQRLLQAQQLRSWKFQQESGLLDPAALARLITDPAYPTPYRFEQQAPYKDTVVTLLLDNSGSMRGRPIMMTALCTDILTRTLERCGVKVEVLGFTTAAWKGGESRKAWVNAGSPPMPGRLNDLMHIIYKSADTPYRRARNHFGLMLKEGLLKENIDGEAILWAEQRLQKRAEERKILMVISDGAPVDDSTLSANPPAFLDQHLTRVISYLEQSKRVELMAIGIGHDVTRYYPHSTTIPSVEKLAETMIDQLLPLFAGM